MTQDMVPFCLSHPYDGTYYSSAKVSKFWFLFPRTRKNDLNMDFKTAPMVHSLPKSLKQDLPDG